MRILAGLAAAGRGLLLAVASTAASIALFCLAVVWIALIPLGVGALVTPVVLTGVRAHAGWRRRVAGTWSRVDVPVSYRPRPPIQGGIIGQLQRCAWMLKDPQTWRDLRWLLVDASAGLALAVLPPGLVAHGTIGPLLAGGLWRPLHSSGDDARWFFFFAVTNQTRAFAAAALGLVMMALGIWLAPAILKGNALLTRSALSPSRKRDLRLRVEQLTESRSEALDTSAAELRRIERDLHDGAQARLVAMGMHLGAVEQLLERDPEQAKHLLAQVRQSSADALHELRDLVRGIHPPVLAERGLGDAVRALALRHPLRSEVTVDLPDRLEAPVESAAYFAVSEVLTNAAKHAEAERVSIDLCHQDGVLRVLVTDDGQGGADPMGGTGLRGVERRLAAFDGVLAVNSPRGGPTVIAIEIPCQPLGDHRTPLPNGDIATTNQ
ncbi:sensor histidine kinase [Wenjunlia vitaminophila]|nr:sensor histidine kinase [Wenjunlia vitaminophila]